MAGMNPLAQGKSRLPFPLTVLLGLMTVSVLASAANLFLPLGSVFAVLLFAGGVVIHWRLNPFRGLRFIPLSAWTWILTALITLAVLEISTHRPSVSDTALYHAQTIRWFEAYPVVPGLGNLHHRLAFNSSWLVLNAALSFSFLGLRSFHLVSGFFFLIVQFFFLGGVIEFSEGKFSWSGLFKVLAIPLSFYLFASVVSSPAYDMPVSLLTWVIVTLWLESTEDESKPNGRDALIFLLSVYAVTIKLSAFPLLLFPALVFATRVKANEKRFAGLLAISAITILILWMVRSVILSGYLVFPISQLDFFSFDWKIPIARLPEIRDGIIGFARLPGRDWESVLTMSFSTWFPLWFENLTANQRVMFIFAGISPFILGLAGLLNPSRVAPRPFFGFIVIYAGMIFWFFSAPDVRFGYGYLAGILLFITSLGLFLLIRKTDSSLIFSKMILPLGLILFQFYFLAFSLDASTLTGRLILPVDYSRSRAEACDIVNSAVYCRIEGGQCNYDKFPCIPSPRMNVKPRGPSFRNGFRVVGND